MSWERISLLLSRQEIFASAPMISSRGAIAINSTFQITNIASLCIAAYI
jgi:hypothetical protein